MKLIPYSEKLRNLKPCDPKMQDDICKALDMMAHEKEYNHEFHGTTIGCVIAQTDIETSMIKEKSAIFGNASDEDILDLLKHGETWGIVPKHTNIFNRTTNELDSRLLYTVLLRPKELSIDKPTITDNMVETVMNASFDLEIEIGLIESDGLFRYFVYHTGSKNVPPFELIKDLFEDELWEYTDDISKEEHDKTFPYDSDIFYPGTDSEGVEGLCVTYYNKFGEAYKIAYSNPEKLLYHIHSIRVIKCETIIDD